MCSRFTATALGAACLGGLLLAHGCTLEVAGVVADASVDDTADASASDAASGSDAGSSSDAAGDIDAAGDSDAPSQDAGPGGELLAPDPGYYYHGVYPGGVTGWEDDLTLADVQSYETAAGRQVAWVYFSNNWWQGHAFPTATATWIRDYGAVPYIRLMLRSAIWDVTEPDPVYSLDEILAGTFDDDLTAWGEAAAAFGTPLIVEWGTDMNGDWYHWNGVWNGGSTSGTANFVSAYRHIVGLIEAAGADNITWVFHVHWEDYPTEAWNEFENYYPGDDVVDWLGVSAFGPETPLDDYWDDFVDELDAAIPRLTTLAPGKPIIVSEFGITGGNPQGTAVSWADPALTALLADTWPAVRGFSWWNETWENDSDPAHDTDMRIQTVPGLSDLFQSHLVGADNVIDRPIFSP